MAINRQKHNNNDHKAHECPKAILVSIKQVINDTTDTSEPQMPPCDVTTEKTEVFNFGHVRFFFRVFLCTFSDLCIFVCPAV
mgnify:CR=1 FL=1